MQEATSARPEELIRKFRGVFDQTDSTKRPKGTVTTDQNIIERQGGDADRRPGRDFELLFGEAVNFLFQFDFDDGAIFQIGGGATVSYEPVVYSTAGDLTGKMANPAVPGPLPSLPSFLPFWDSPDSNIPDYVPMFRALSEARKYINAGTDDLSYPSQVWALDFYEPDAEEGDAPKVTNISTKTQALYWLGQGYRPRRVQSNDPIGPTNGEALNFDFYWVDYFCSPNRIVNDLSYVRQSYNSVKNSYVKTEAVEGAASVANYTGADDVALLTAKAHMGEWIASMVSKINLLLRVKVTGGQTDTSIKTADAGYTYNYNICDDAKQVCESNWQDAVWWPEYTSAILAFEKTFTHGSDPVSCVAEIWRISGKLTADLSSYASGSASIYLKCSPPTDLVAGQDPPTPADGTYHSYVSATPGLVYTSTSLINDIDTPPSWTLACPIAAPFGSGWQIDDVLAVVTRNAQYQAYFGVPGNFVLVSPDEYFTKSAAQVNITSSETDITWDLVKRSSSGGADPSYPNTNAIGNPAPITSTATLLYSSNAPGFDKARFPFGIYRPCILLYLQAAPYTVSGSPTTLTFRLYINSVLVSTASSAISTGKAFWAFSVKGVGDYGTARPPQNNPGDSLNGWSAPIVRLTAQADAGTVGLGTSTKLMDYVLLYPFG